MNERTSEESCPQAACRKNAALMRLVRGAARRAMASVRGSQSRAYPQASAEASRAAITPQRKSSAEGVSPMPQPAML